MKLAPIFGSCVGCEPRKGGYDYGETTSDGSKHDAIDIVPKAVWKTPFDKKWNIALNTKQYAVVYAITDGTLWTFAPDIVDGVELRPTPAVKNWEFTYTHIKLDDDKLPRHGCGLPVTAGERIGMVKTYDEPTHLVQRQS